VAHVGGLAAAERPAEADESSGSEDSSESEADGISPCGTGVVVGLVGVVLLRVVANFILAVDFEFYS
jgi:hypothetical protein